VNVQFDEDQTIDDTSLATCDHLAMIGRPMARVKYSLHIVAIWHQDGFRVNVPNSERLHCILASLAADSGG
jgi:hypothetical protein